MNSFSPKYILSFNIANFLRKETSFTTSNYFVSVTVRTLKISRYCKTFSKAFILIHLCATIKIPISGRCVLRIFANLFQMWDGKTDWQFQAWNWFVKILGLMIAPAYCYCYTNVMVSVSVTNTDDRVDLTCDNFF